VILCWKQLAGPHFGVLELLALASLNTMTLLGAETVGRSYGGGILKLEPREADVLSVLGLALVARVADELRDVRGQVAGLLEAGELMEAVAVVNRVLLTEGLGMSGAELETLRVAHTGLANRRHTRTAKGRLQESASGRTLM
jgi:adenine-specific DNA-methyltransferase